jgi:2-(1,2-epoxy-1,2-dihydrophenyl)acetyl-CoA isomerase
MFFVLLDVKDGVATITLNRPDKLNSFNRAMAFELQAHLDECQTRSDIRAVYLTGAGKGFCAGQDLEEVLDPNGPGMNRILSEHFNPIVMRIAKLEKPIVAAVNGVAAGAGANIALACDICVASDAASFIQAFSKIGLIPDSGGTHTLPRLIGWQKATALMMLGDKVSATEAEKMGMIYKVFPADSFVTESMAIAQTLAAMPTKALALTKQALLMSHSTSLLEQLQDEDVLQQKAAATADFKEGVQAFVEKRKPNYKGV